MYYTYTYTMDYQVQIEHFIERIADIYALDPLEIYAVWRECTKKSEHQTVSCTQKTDLLNPQPMCRFMITRGKRKGQRCNVKVTKANTMPFCYKHKKSARNNVSPVLNTFSQEEHCQSTATNTSSTIKKENLDRLGGSTLDTLIHEIQCTSDQSSTDSYSSVNDPSPGK